MLIVDSFYLFPRADGEGRQTYVNGDVYKGQWSEGKMHGKVSYGRFLLNCWMQLP